MSRVYLIKFKLDSIYLIGYNPHSQTNNEKIIMSFTKKQLHLSIPVVALVLGFAVSPVVGFIALAAGFILATAWHTQHNSLYLAPSQQHRVTTC